MVDVSLILNLHKESIYLTPTLNSLTKAIKFAQESNIQIELIAVLDNSDSITRSNLKSFDFSYLDNFQYIDVNFGSLGLSRNIGIEHASGKYIFTADGDDLISSNAIKVLFDLAELSPSNSNRAYFMEYLVAFGEKYYVAKFENSSGASIEEFISQNMYTSRIFAPRNLLQLFKYKKVEINSGYGFEDWDLNNRLYCAGVDLLVAKDTVLFYRTRSDGLLSQYGNAKSVLVARSELHSSKAIITRKKTATIESVSDFAPIKTLADEMTTNRHTLSHILDAIDTEPSILIDHVKNAVDFSPAKIDSDHWATCFTNLIGILNGEEFSEIVLFQTLNPGGAEKYILQILDSIDLIDKESRILIFTLDDSQTHIWRQELNESITFIDLRNLFPHLAGDDFDQMLINVLLSVSRSRCRLHFKTSVYNQNFFEKYNLALSKKFETIYYRFSDSEYLIQDRQFRDGHITKFLQKNIEFISKIISDNQFIIDQDIKIFGSTYSKKYQLIDAIVENKNKWKKGKPSNKILWASRFAWEKRPEILIEISKNLNAFNADLSISIYGRNTLPELMNELLRNKNVMYHGEFSNFSEIPIDEYDFLLYTSRFEGTPNIILEALASGLPVIAPAVGGISETLPNPNFLVPNSPENEIIANSYLRQIISLYSNYEESVQLFELNSEIICNKHSKENHSKNVYNVFKKDLLSNHES